MSCASMNFDRFIMTVLLRGGPKRFLVEQGGVVTDANF